MIIKSSKDSPEVEFLYDLSINKDGIINSGAKMTVEEELSGYMFLPVPLKKFKKHYPNQKIFFDEQALVEILSKEDFKSPETQEKLKEILKPVLKQLS